jgi:hypothetical protein
MSTEEKTPVDQPSSTAAGPPAPDAVSLEAMQAMHGRLLRLAAAVDTLTESVKGVQLDQGLRHDVEELKRLFVVLNENQAGQYTDSEQLAERVGALERAAAPAPSVPMQRVHVDQVRTLPSGGAPVPGGPALPVLRPAPSAPPGTLPPVQAAPPLGAVTARPVPGGVEMMIDPSRLGPGQSFDIPGTDITIRNPRRALAARGPGGPMRGR